MVLTVVLFLDSWDRYSDTMTYSVLTVTQLFITYIDGRPLPYWRHYSAIIINYYWWLIIHCYYYYDVFSIVVDDYCYWPIQSTWPYSVLIIIVGIYLFCWLDLLWWPVLLTSSLTEWPSSILFILLFIFIVGLVVVLWAGPVWWYDPYALCSTIPCDAIPLLRYLLLFELIDRRRWFIDPTGVILIHSWYRPFIDTQYCWYHTFYYDDYSIIDYAIPIVVIIASDDILLLTFLTLFIVVDIGIILILMLIVMTVDDWFVDIVIRWYIGTGIVGDDQTAGVFIPHWRDD